MAFIPTQDDEENNNASTNTNQVVNQSTGSNNAGGAQPTTGGGGVGGSPSGVNANGSQSNAGFAGIMDYLGANKDQAAPMAGQIAGNLGQEYNDTKGAIDNAVTSANTDVNNGTVNYNQDVVNNAVQNPATFVQDPNNVSAFDAQRDAAYTGPGSFEDTGYYGDASKAATKANDTYTAATSTPGYSGLLSQIETNPTAGKSALDAGLLQTDPNAQSQIKAALDPFSGINDYLSGQASNVDQNIANAQTTSNNTSSQTKQALADAEKGFEGGLAQKTTDATNNVAANTSAARQLFSNLLTTDVSQVPDSLLSSLGLTRDDLTQMKADQQNLTSGFVPPDANVPGVTPIPSAPADFSQYLGQPTAINPQTVASSDDYAKSAALAQLMGEGYAPYLSDSSLAGTGLNPTFDKTSMYNTINPEVQAITTDANNYRTALQSTEPTIPSQPGNTGGGVTTQPVTNPGGVSTPPPALPPDNGAVTTPENAGSAAVMKAIQDEKAKNKAAGTKGAVFTSGNSNGVF